MSPILASTIIMLSKYTMYMCIYNLITIGAKPLGYLVDKKIKEMEEKQNGIITN